ncbi:glycosyltransferase [Microbacterium sp. BG28]|nr:glycosyltransferase [Microbacterium sp. BG28]
MPVQGLRRIVRALREVPVLGPIVRAGDRLWWWRVIRRSHLVDPAFYAAQLGVHALPRDAAIVHYVSVGFRRGLSLNPLFDEIHAGGTLPEVFRVPALYAYLLSERPTVQVHPLWDAVAFARDGTGDQPAALEDVWLRQDARILLAAPGASRQLTVVELRAEAIDAARQWRRGRPFVNPTARALSELDLVRVVQRRDRGYARKLQQVSSLVADARVTATIALVDVDASQWLTAVLLARMQPGIRLCSYPADAIWSRVVADAVDAGAAPLVAALDARAAVSDQELDELIGRAGAGVCVVPAHREENGTSCGVGIGWVGAVGGDCIVLGDHPHEDVMRLGDQVEVPRPLGRSFIMPRPAARAAFDAARADDLSDIVWDGMPRCIALPTVAPVLDEPEHAFRRRRADRARRVVHRDERDRIERILSEAGFSVRTWRLDQGAAVPTLAVRRRGASQQRWAIKICSPAGRRGEVWGDTHFAQGLAAALRRAGHVVVVDAFGAARRKTAYLDDVNVVVRGPYRIKPPETGVNLEWIISHPDEITRAELEQFDRVFAASEPWAERASRRWNIAVDPLLECTDTDKFTPRGLTRGTDIVFVGTARGIARPSVVAPVRAGIDVKVYGPDWRPFVPASVITAESIDNEDLPALYERASIVLNDQWPAMRREGFIAMRPFDVVAVGGRVISEQVYGIEELFQGAVVTYRDADHLVELLRADPDTIFPEPHRLEEISETIRREHSFDARAAVLAAAAGAVSSGLDTLDR